jgi:adenine/guanine/hypoxanthine permease
MPFFRFGSYRWATASDVNAFFAFLLDAVVNLFVLSALLQIFDFPVDIINQRIIPGAIVGIVVGNGLYVWLGFRNAVRSGHHQITAIPLGLDLTTTVGFTLSVLVPIFLGLRAELGDARLAGEITWYVGMAATMWMGVVKLICSGIARFIQRSIPVAALVGSMFGIAIVWLGANAIMGIFEMPHIGLIALVVMIYSLIGGRDLPFKLPGAVVAIILSTIAYYVMGWSGALEGLGYGFAMPDLSGTGLSLPVPTLAGFEEFGGRALNYLAIIVPLGVLIAASSINITAAAKLVGDDYDPGQVIRIDAAATIVSALFGGVIQTTPYFGHTTYKRMNARVGYSAAAAALLLIVGVLGVMNALIALVPAAAIKPILIVVASDIVRLCFGSIPKDHGPAVAFATMPAILNFTYVKVSALYETISGALNGTQYNLASIVPAQWMAEYVLLGALARGYILTGLLWASIVVFLVDRQLLKASFMLVLSSLFAFFGVIHSVLGSSSLYLPWKLSVASEGGLTPGALAIPFGFASGYLIAALVALVLYWGQGWGHDREENNRSEGQGRE